MSNTFSKACFVCLTIMAVPLFSQQVTMDNMDSLNLANDGPLYEKYIKESQKLHDEFTTLRERMNKEVADVDEQWYNGVGRWEREYYQPFYEKSKQAMRRVTGTDDDLSFWENSIPQKISKGIKDKDQSREFQRFGEGSYLFLNYTLAIVHERRAEILRGTEYDDSDKGEKIRKLRPDRFYTSWPGLGPNPTEQEKYREELKKMNIYFVFPPRFLQFGTTYDESWQIMAVYSFKNDRARDLLLDIAVNPSEKVGSLASWAVYYLSLFPNSGVLLPKIKTLLQEQILIAQRERPDLSESLFHDNGELKDLSLKQYRYTLSNIRYLPDSIDQMRTYDIFYKIWRLLILKNSLEHNEKIPEEERGRFEILRRELAISWALCAKHNRKSPEISAVLKNGDEHFEIYLKEYGIPTYGNISFQWEEDDEPYPYSRENPRWQTRKAFYENELANPRPIYTESQLDYLRMKVKEMEHLK